MPDLPLQSDEDAQALEKALREAKPGWSTDGFGVRGPQDPRIGPASNPGPQAKVTREPKQPAFPDLTPDTVDTPVAAAELNHYGFKLSFVKVDRAAYTVKIHVGYGEIGYPGVTEPPTGMTGADDYVLTIPGAADGTEIYAVITYNPDTLAITSRTLAFDFSVPASVLGTLNVPIGFVDITYDGSGGIKDVNPSNRHCGDIVFVFEYGTVNGAEALIPVAALADFVAIT